jgi:large subunit ribosomal protein L21
MKLAIVKTGGKQYTVSAGKEFKVEKLEGNVGDKVSLETLMIADSTGSSLELGTDAAKTKVEAEITEQGRADKVSIVKFKCKTRYRRRVGHRQPFTKLKVLAVAGESVK